MLTLSGHNLHRIFRLQHQAPMSDCEPARNPNGRGYRCVSDFIAKDNDDLCCIYRRFRSLSARNLLYLENDLAVLEKRLRDYDERLLVPEMDWQRAKGESDSARNKLAEDIRIAIERYHDALIRESQVANLYHADKHTLDIFRWWFDERYKRNEKDMQTKLDGLSANRLEDDNDLCSLHTSTEQDRLTKFLCRNAGSLFPYPNSSGMNHIQYSSDQLVARVVLVSSIFFAAAFLIGSIVTLYFVRKSNIRLILISCFTAGFALYVGLFTNARRSEIFAATAAYAAVLVVFVSGDLGNS